MPCLPLFQTCIFKGHRERSLRRIMVFVMLEPLNKCTPHVGRRGNVTTLLPVDCTHPACVYPKQV